MTSDQHIARNGSAQEAAHLLDRMHHEYAKSLMLSALINALERIETLESYIENLPTSSNPQGRSQHDK